jgi:hypothetical protein
MAGPGETLGSPGPLFAIRPCHTCTHKHDSVRRNIFLVFVIDFWLTVTRFVFIIHFAAKMASRKTKMAAMIRQMLNR